MNPEQRTTSETSSNTRVELGDHADKIARQENSTETQSTSQDEKKSGQNAHRAHFGDPFSNKQVENVDAEDEPKSERRILDESECFEELGFGFTETKKWTILTVIFLVQVSMNFNTVSWCEKMDAT